MNTNVKNDYNLLREKEKGWKSYLSYFNHLKTSEMRLNANNLMEVLYG